MLLLLLSSFVPLALCLYDFAPQLGWKQQAHLSLRQLQATLRTLADWHAFFFLAHDPAGTKAALAAQLWPTASYWHLGITPPGQLEKLEPNWRRLAAEFGPASSAGVTGFEPGRELGARLARHAHAASACAHGLTAENQKLAAWENAKYATIIHGDPKAANVFFKQRVGCNQAGGVDVGIIDLQWCGCGLGAVDVAYCIAASADPSVFEGAGEGGPVAVAQVERLIREYHAHLLAGFVQHGVAPDLPAARAVLPADIFQVQVGFACAAIGWSSDQH
eukprot:SAG22_NODE_805_length_7096_cov_28.481206_5_plen_276_part_00